MPSSQMAPPQEMTLSRSLRIIFAGTPDFAARHLAVLLSTTHQIIGVFTQPDRPAGRGNKLTPSPVKRLAEQHAIPLFQPPSLRPTENQTLIANLEADVMVVVAYGLLLPQSVLKLPLLGCINVHGSLLPRWRGAAPIQRALWAGDNMTGITIMQMDAGLDTGDMLHKVHLPITEQDTSASLYDKLAQLGPQALLTTLSQLSHGNARAEKQDDMQATYAQKLTKEEARLNWTLSAKQLASCIRAFNPWPGSHFMLNGQPIKVWQSQVLEEVHQQPPGIILRADKRGIAVATSQGILLMTQLQPAGKKVMSAQDLLNARRDEFAAGRSLMD